MTKTEFAERIAAEVGGTVKGIVKNNNTICTGIEIENDDNVKPVIYIDSLYDKGMTVEKAIEEIKEQMARQITVDFDKSIVEDFEKAKKHLSLRLYNANNEYEVFRSAKKYGFDDLIIVPVLNDVIPNGSVKINASIVKSLGVTEDEIFEAAETNINAEDYSIINMTEILSEMMGVDPLDLPPTEMDMYVVTSKDRMFGAYGAIALKNKLKEVFPDGYIVIPSSVHEVIVIPNTGNDDEIKQMINEVNEEQVAPDEVLGTKPYIFAA